MGIYKSLCGLIGPYLPYVSLQIFLGPYASLWVLMCPYSSLRVLMDPYTFLWIPM